MDKKQIMNTFRSLAKSQGFYGRICNYIDSLDEKAETIS